MGTSHRPQGEQHQRQRQQQQQRSRKITTFDQFVKFITDASGLERTFRLLQAITQILTSYERIRHLMILTTSTLIIQITSTCLLPLFTIIPVPVFPFLDLLGGRGGGGGGGDKSAVFTSSSSSSSSSSADSTISFVHALLSVPTLRQLRGSFALGRRFFRVGRFLDSFRSAWRLYSTTSSSSSSFSTTSTGPGSGLQTVQNYLAILAASFNGCYLLLETLHFPEVLLGLGAATAGFASTTSNNNDINPEEQLRSFWSPELAQTLHVEGQRFWFFALVCGAAAGLVKLINLRVLRVIPSLGSGQNLGASSASSSSFPKCLNTPPGEVGESKRQSEQEQETVKEEKRIEQLNERKERQAREREEFIKTSRKVSRRIMADLLDLALPGTVVGWTNLDSGMLGLCMLGSTILTGLEVWEKCGGGE